MKIIVLSLTFLLASCATAVATSTPTHDTKLPLPSKLVVPTVHAYDLAADDADIRSYVPDHLRFAPLVLVGIRGYTRVPGHGSSNERLYFDDIIAVVTPTAVRIFPASVDPTGWGFNSHPMAMKWFASLDANHTYYYKMGTHNPPMGTSYPAFVQAGPVYYTRDDQTHGQANSSFNIHKAWPAHVGGLEVAQNSSWGCQVVVAMRWSEFYELVANVIQEKGLAQFPYILANRR